MSRAEIWDFGFFLKKIAHLKLNLIFSPYMPEEEGQETACEEEWRVDLYQCGVGEHFDPCDMTTSTL